MPPIFVVPAPAEDEAAEADNDDGADADDHIHSGALFSRKTIE